MRQIWPDRLILIRHLILSIRVSLLATGMQGHECFKFKGRADVMWLRLCCQTNNDSHMLSTTQGVRNCTVIGVLEAPWEVGGAASAEGGAR